MSAATQRTDVEKFINQDPNNSQTDVEKTINHDGNSPNSPISKSSYNPTTRPFIGRLGGNQEFVLDRHNAANAEILREQPDSAPCMTLREQFDLGGFQNLGLWKAAVIEGIGQFSPFMSLQPRLQTDKQIS
jgi:hypothetical protein